MINLLPKEISELIAAGEVIERPASIVKELLENSIDAGAKTITVEIKNGGISYIRVTDNGCGMTEEDLAVSFLRHATSKIKNEADLNNIATLGFRGEALASVSAVSRLEITSKTIDMQYGSKITIEAGEQLDFDNVGAQNGTTVTVRDLFFNVPARLKFLKKDSSEASAINGIIDKLAVSKPGISFKFISDGKIKLHTSGNGDQLSAIHSVFGEEFSSVLIPVLYEMNGIKVEGFIAKPQYSRSNRGMQHFFVNSRYVRSKTCMVAVEEGYKNNIMTGKYPSCVLNIILSCSSIDVNVHPAKIEVRFTNEKPVFDVVYFAVKAAIASDDLLKATTVKTGVNGNPSATFKSEEASQIVIQPSKDVDNTRENTIVNQNAFTYKKDEFIKKTTGNENRVSSPSVQYSVVQDKQPKFSYITEDSFKKSEFSKVNVETSINIVPQEDNKEMDSSITVTEIKHEQNKDCVMPNAKIIGEIFSTYLVFEFDGNMLLLDKHAAHERIIYEQLKKSVTANDRQVLLKSEIISLSSEEFDSVCNNFDVLLKLGFSVEEFGNHSIIVREAPMLMLNGDFQGIITDIAKKLIDNRKDILGNSFEDLLHSIACRAAIKANDKTNISELTELLYQVYKDDEIRHCPHGRPIVISISKNEIEKKFGRI